jgi:hypothetical protein
VSGKKLLVDTGSAFSIFPHKSASKPFGPLLKAANGQRIRCWGSPRRSLKLSGLQYQWQFVQAAVSFPILGIDFLMNFGLLVDVVGEKLIPRDSVTVAGGDEVYAVFQQPPALPGIPSTTKPTYAQVVAGGGSQGGPAAGSTEAPSNAAAADWEQLLREFPAVVQPFTVSSSPQHGVQHHIITTGRPVTAKFRGWIQLA